MITDYNKELKESGFWWMFTPMAVVLLIVCFFKGCETPAMAQTIEASWYSVQSLKKEGTWSYSHGRMANGHIFRDTELTCATRLFPLDSMVHIVNLGNNRSVNAVVTDRIGKRFGKTRIDLSRSAFSKIADLRKGLIKITVRRIQ